MVSNALTPWIGIRIGSTDRYRPKKRERERERERGRDQGFTEARGATDLLGQDWKEWKKKNERWGQKRGKERDRERRAERKAARRANRKRENKQKLRQRTERERKSGALWNRCYHILLTETARSKPALCYKSLVAWALPDHNWKVFLIELICSTCVIKDVRSAHWLIAGSHWSIQSAMWNSFKKTPQWNRQNHLSCTHLVCMGLFLGRGAVLM